MTLTSTLAMFLDPCPTTSQSGIPIPISIYPEIAHIRTLSPALPLP